MVRPLRDALLDLLPQALARHPAVAFVYLGGGAATGDLRAGELIAIAYDLRPGTPAGAFDEDAFFADLAARFDTNDLEILRLGSLPPDRLAAFLRDAVLLAAPDAAAHGAFLAGRGVRS